MTLILSNCRHFLRLTPRGLGVAIGLVLWCAVASAETPLERGRYLMNSIVACGNCHTPQGPAGPQAGMELAGGFLIEEKEFTIYAPNITPHKGSGIGLWSDAQIITAIREGKRPDGTIIGPPMPIGLYRGMSDSDVKAIVAYLRSVKPVDNKPAKSVYRIPLPTSYGPPLGQVADVPRSDKVAYGRYLAGPLGHCIECHTPQDATGMPQFATKLGAGGMAFHGPWGVSVSTNITPTGLTRYSDAQLKTLITTGVRPDGSRLKPPMGVAYYASLAAADQDALVAYLRSLPPR
jgi:mono/diheme cytochrome c family protein